jgi:protein TonB
MYRIGALAFGLAIVSAACGGTPPKTETAAANAAIDGAASQGAEKYAPDSFKAAQNARAALDAELKAQDDKWIKSYDRAKDLATAAKAAGDQAAADAVAGKQKAAAAARVRADAAARAKASARMAALRVGGQIKLPTKVKDVKPVYPAIAQSAHVSGTVVIEATIGTDGKVADTKVIHSVPLLDQAAVDAVRQWEYIPTLLNGVPVPLLTKVTVNFAK